MKKQFFFIAIMFAMPTLQAQDYSISFSAAGASTAITKIIIENRTKGISATLNGNDILHLSGITGTNTFKEKDHFRIKTFPNPMPGMCKVDFQTQVQGSTNIELYNVSGKMVLQKKEQLAPGNYTFSLSGLKSGSYLLKINSGAETRKSKIICVSDGSGIAEINRNTSSLVDMEIAQKQEVVSTKSIQGNKSEVVMVYSEGDHILVKAYDGIYSSYSVLDPTLSNAFIILFNPCIDADGKSYPVTQIGSKFWMAENLKSAVLNDGTPLSDKGWNISDSAAYCNYLYTKNTDTINTYGRLYNWHAVNTGKLCPKGWHVPTHDEWISLNTYLGERVSGGILKETGTAHWLSPNEGATDLFGFSAVPGGWRGSNGVFNFMGKYGFYWSSTPAGTTGAKMWSFEFDNAALMSDPSNRNNGFCVRCIND